MRPFLALSFLAVLLSGCTSTPMTGTWKVVGDIRGNALTPSLDLKQEGEKLTGVTKSEEGQDQDIIGQITDKGVTWQYAVEYRGSVYTLIYTGTLPEAGNIKGTITVQPVDVEGTFTATKAENK